MTKVKSSKQSSAKTVSLPRGNLSEIAIEGFKSIRKPCKLELSALNILAGANSSGKSSFMQPLLLLKQTMESPYNPGPLLINGPNVKFTELSQMFSKLGDDKKWEVNLLRVGGAQLKYEFGLDKEQQLTVLDLVVKGWHGKLHFAALQAIIHVPGLRGNPERNYPITAVGESYPGRFDVYVASIIADWQEKKDLRLDQLDNQLQQLGLTWKVIAQKLDYASVELRVGRLPVPVNRTDSDLVSIADVGFGVSQVLPVLVALLVAQQGQIVYIEQPETHLHPKAQRALAQIFSEATARLATVVVETHSMLFVREIQTLVAQKSLSRELVKLHWVERDDKGDTQVTSADLDVAGAYGSWPQDFDKTEMEAELAYIAASEAVLLRT